MLSKSESNSEIRVSVDFNTTGQDLDGRVIINIWLHPELKEVLQPDMRVKLYDEILEVEANIEIETHQGEMWWFGRPDWSTAVDLPYP